MSTKLEDYLKTKGINVAVEKKSGRGKVLSACPWCGKESSNIQNEHCGIIISGKMEYVHCFVCAESGGLNKLKKHYGDWVVNLDEPDVEILQDSSGVRMLTWHKKDADEVDNSMRAGKDLISRSTDFLWHKTYDKALLAVEYLKNIRQFSEKALKHWKIGLVVRGKCPVDTCGFYGSPEEGKKCPKCSKKLGNLKLYISVPFFDEEGTLQNVKYRSIPPADKRFEREKGGSTILYGLDTVDFSKPVIITEAELDAIACYQLGMTNVISLGGASNWSDDWRSKFISCPMIYICMDKDKAGRDAHKQISKALGAWRCKTVNLPDGVKDVAEFLEFGGDSTEWKKIVKNSVLGGEPIWLKANEIFPELQKMIDLGEDAKGIPTGWKSLDRLMGGIRPSELSIVTSQTGSGKSIWTNELAINIARQGIPVAICSFELTPRETLMRSLSQMATRSYWELVGEKNKQILEMTVSQLTDMPLYYLNINGELPVDKLLGMIRWAIVRFGIEFSVIDHLHYFLPGMGSKNERFIIDKASRKLKQSCKEWDIHEMLVVHPSKHESRSPLGVRTSENDLKGSSGIKQEADCIISMYRARGLESAMSESGRAGTSASEIAVLKMRSTLGKEGKYWQEFSSNGLNYTDISRSTQKLYSEIDARAIDRMKRGQDAEQEASLMEEGYTPETSQESLDMKTEDDPFSGATGM